MTQSIRGHYQFTSHTAQRMEEIISKLNELGTGTGVGASYYPAATSKLQARFGDHANGITHVVLAPHEIAAVRAYIDQKDVSQDDPACAKIRALFKEADDVLGRAQDYLREQTGAPLLPKPRVPAERHLKIS